MALKHRWLLAAILVLMPTAALASSVIFGPNSANQITTFNLPPKTIVLTFDDGPSDYTPGILEVLKSKGVPATFFVIGTQALAHPLLKDEYSAGMEIGNHTYDHASLENLPDWRLRLELGLNRFIIENQTGHSSRLFRPPYIGSDDFRLNPAADRLAERAGQAGYITVGEDIDSDDWRRPGVDEIVATATSAQSSAVILFHDGGGNRQQTIEALPAVIDYYRSQGYRFSTVADAMALGRASIMPPVSTGDRFLALAAGTVFGAKTLLVRVLLLVILVLIAASMIRMVLVIVAAMIQAGRRRVINPQYQPFCSVVVPAYNEALVIEACLNSILASHYKYFEIILVDDGSTDQTYVLAQSIDDPRLRLLRQPNAGKASALNHGIRAARGEFVVAIDADTRFTATTISRLIGHFADSRVGAVSGNTKIANRRNLITKMQALEYIIGFNLDRRMGDLFDCITVVPGAVGAFRRRALREVGGFALDTLAEDTDLTLLIKEAGYSIIYDDQAVAHTEAPATTSDLLKQRFRWTFGTMQAVWKHRRSILNPRRGTLGLIGLPYLVFYQIVFPLISPLFDLAMIMALIYHRFSLMLISLVVYTLLDLVTATVAIKLDHEKLRQLWLIVPQRFYYRQLMYYVLARSLVNVMRGRLVGWNKLKRQAAT